MKKGLNYLVLNYFIFAFSSFLFAQEPEVTFERLSLPEGLSQNNVLCMLQDRKGYIWFGTYDGLNRYDGYSFKVFNFDYQDTTSLAQNLVMSLFEDSRGAIWVGLAGSGLCRFDPLTEKFTCFPVKKNTPGSLPQAAITAINEDKEGNIWIGNVAGLYLFNPQTEKFKSLNLIPGQKVQIGVACISRDAAGILWFGSLGHGLFKFKNFSIKGDTSNANFIQYKNLPGNPYSLSNNIVTAIFEDQDAVLWIGTLGGLNKLDRKSNIFSHYLHDSINFFSISSNLININAITEDKSGNIWIGTTFGLNKLNLNRTSFSPFFNNPADPGSLSSNDIHSLLIDQTGVLWVGTINGGINRSDLRPKQFSKLAQNPSSHNLLSQNGVRALYEDHEGILWIGTEGGGLISYNKTTKNFEHYKHDPFNINSLSSDFVGAILEDSKENLWIGFGGSNYLSENGGLSKLDRKTGNFTHISIHSEDAPEFNDTKIFSIYEDKDGFIWISTQNGIKRLNPTNNEIIHFLHYGFNPSDLSDAWCYAIFEDSRQNIWIGTGSNSLNRMDKRTEKITHYSYDPSDPKSISSHSVRQIFEDTKGRIWIATSGGGLNHFDPISETFTAYTEKEGLSSNSIHRIEEDEEGNLWLSSNNGLCRFDPMTKKIDKFDYKDGLQSNQFASGYTYTGASCKSKDGTLYFGGSEGITSFHPKNIQLNNNIPPIVITQFSLFDKPVPGLNESREVTLKYNENVFSFEFSALNFTNPHKNQYAYQLENFDQDWIYSGTRRYASYTNLDPGTYTFRVKGSNNDGLWNEDGASLQITIQPPWWQTWWAYGLLALLVVGMILSIRHYEIKRLKLRQRAIYLSELDSLKSHFFANISHEFRTPLSLILGPLERFIKESQPQESKVKVYRMMYRNGKRLLRLINQLLDLSKLEVGQLTLQEKPGNLTLFLKNIVYSFNSLAEKKEITYLNSFPHSAPPVKFDADKLEKILVNLLSNAFKFTSAGGTVEVQVSLEKPYTNNQEEKQDLIFTIKDTGIGIPDNQLEKVFDRFYQVDGSHTREKEGSGIGLALTKELVSLHGGTIKVESNRKGTKFTVRLPLTAANDADEATINDTTAQAPVAGLLVLENEESETVADDLSITPAKAPLLLLVEDNPDVRTFMREFLASHYRILEAKNGLEALDCAFEKIPDLIVSDIMMPGMDGIELCKRLKTDERTSHIPIILLTARAGEASKLEGLETGADDYLTKPFQAEELTVRIKNLIEQRAKLRECFSKKISVQPKDITVTSTDEKFLQKALQIMEVKIDDTEFDVESFSKEMGMSRVQLHRKLKALTDQSPSALIRIFRLKRAACLLEGQTGNISEIAFSVGFNSLTYFTRAFKQYYGKTPSDYIYSHSKSI